MKILLPTDGSEYSETAAEFLTGLDLSHNDEITILHVIKDDPFEDNADYHYAKIREIRTLVAPNMLNSVMNILKSVPAKLNTVLMDGYPDKCIVDKAVDSNVDIIVMGPKRLKGIRSRIVGSVTKSVSVMSPKPVLIVKPSRVESPHKMKILFATDGSDYARKAGEIITLIPFPDDVEITVLNVITPAFYDIPDKFMTNVDARFREDIKKYSSAELQESEKIIEQTTKHLGNKFSNIDKLTKVGDPSDEILHTANELNTDIIVVGSKGMGGFTGIVGSISRYILSVAECSVLIGKTAPL